MATCWFRQRVRCDTTRYDPCGVATSSPKSRLSPFTTKYFFIFKQLPITSLFGCKKALFCFLLFFETMNNFVRIPPPKGRSLAKFQVLTAWFFLFSVVFSQSESPEFIPHNVIRWCRTQTAFGKAQTPVKWFLHPVELPGLQHLPKRCSWQQNRDWISSCSLVSVILFE